jgi:hypothetical protein
MVCQHLNEFSTKKIYSKGFGLGKINHTCPRFGLSGLNEHLYSYNLIPSWLCKRCSHSKTETSEHFFLYCDKYDELRKTLFHKIKWLFCPNVNLNSFKNELNTYLVELFLQRSDDLSMDDNIVIFQCVYEFIENSNRFL